MNTVQMASLASPSLSLNDIEKALHAQQEPKEPHTCKPADCIQIAVCAVGWIAVAGIIYSVTTSLPSGITGCSAAISALMIGIYMRVQCLAKEAAAAENIEEILPILKDSEKNSTTRFQRVKSMFSTILETAKTEQQKVEGRYIDLEQEHKNASSELLEATGKLDSFGESIRQSELDLQNSQKGNLELVNQVQTLEQKITQLSSDIHNLHKDKATLELQLRELNESEQAHLGEQKAENQITARQIAKLSSQNQLLAQKIQELSAEKLSLSNEKLELQGLIAKWRAEEIEASQKLDEASLRQSNKIAELEQRLKA